MLYTDFVTTTLAGLGLKPTVVFNSFQPPYALDTGWDLKMPDADISSDSVIVLHFQDFITATDQGILELAKVENHFKDRSDRVIVMHMIRNLDQYYTGPCHLIEFSSHNVITVQRLLKCRDLWQPMLDQPKTNNWMSLNGRECNHRFRAVELLKLLPNGVFGYGSTYPLPGDWPYKTYRGTENDENFVRLIDLYAQSAVNVVTETSYACRPGVISEKTILAAVAGQIPIVIGHQGIVKDCQELGFDMFQDVVNIDYDTANNSIRVEQAINDNESLLVDGIDLEPLKDRLQQQQVWALEKLEARYQQMFLDRATIIAQKLLN